jgi:NADP-dependent aldehyde dehydrogenase
MITGKNLVGGVWESSASEVVFKTVNPNTKEQLTTSFQEATSDQLSQAVEKASAAFEVYSTSSFQMRAQFLSAIQEEIKNNSNEILAIYQAESALPEGRAKGELQRTLDQIERFISLLNEGSFSQATIHTQGPDLRKVLFPIGPIVVFGASNFPLAFSTAGGDTISAFAAGCPVVVKAHPYHAGTSELVAQAIQTAIQKMNLPHGLFSHLGGESYAVGSALVAHPLVKGVGFTGSFKGGKALYDLAQKRSEPIPVFAEMGSVNPMFILENKLKTDGTLAADLASSITLGTGQFCTNPGLIVLCDPENKSGFIDQIRKEINEISLPPMVHANIEANYHEHLTALETINEDVQLHTSDNSHAAIGVVSAPHFKMNPSLSEEVFGPFSMIVCCQTLDEMIAVAEGLNGQLTATILGSEADQKAIRLLLPKVQPKVGRILFEGLPTGVAVTKAMQHGGPYPASTDSRFTSVGSDAIYRWLRPLAFQDCPDALLPLPLQNQNPLGVQRNVNGLLTNKAL